MYFVAIGAAISAYCAQNTGAGKIDRVQQGFRAATVLGLIYSAIIMPLMFFCGKFITPLFVSEN